ncbi:MAG TPA: polysaccharide biosynthesis tyrosine autokinase [Candidatus Acidoferrum sp.]|jgi:succinoglycan biosynthesis transport protein ExoP|nr:polysaccharide biosynthesis tyrosine autokinase [Candidatus Acidoferrum sp.]
MDPTKASPAPDNKLHFLDYWRIIRIRKTVILAVFLLVVITATLVTFVYPESYASVARIKIERDVSDITPLNGSPALSLGYDPYFIQTEFEVIQSEVIVGKVVDDLALDKKWATPGEPPLKRDQAMAVLKNHMDLRPVRNTSLIEIRVYSENKNEAADLANKIAETYQAHRIEERMRLGKTGIDSLLKTLDERQEKVKDAQKKVEDLREKLKISDAMAAGDTPTILFSAETLRRFETLRIESQAELAREQTMLDQLKVLPVDQLAQAIPSTGVQDQLLISLLQDKILAEQKLVSLKKDYGPENSEVLKISSAVEDLNAKIKERVSGFLTGLDTKVAAMKQSLAELKHSVEEAQQNDINKATESRPYWEAKRELEESQRFRALIDQKILIERTDLMLPKSSMVEIVDKAVPGMRPVRPNKTLNIALGIVVGLVVGVGLAFFIEYLDTSVKTIDDVERALGSAVLGVIPQNVGVLLDEGAESPHAEAYRVLRTNLLFSRKDDKLNSVAVVSAGAGEGKSTTVFNLAVVFAQSGQRVLIVDSDLRRPTLHKMLRVTNNLGLTNYLLKQNTLEEVIQTTSLPTLDFLASGKLPSSSLGILSSSQMRDLITELKQHYDFVFFDSPPVMGVSDASILASEVDMTLQVIQYRRYPQPMNIRAKQLIEKVGGNLVGIVLNNINMSQDESYYYYSGYYHDYYARNEDQEPAAAPAGTSAAKYKSDIKPKY